MTSQFSLPIVVVAFLVSLIWLAWPAFVPSTLARPGEQNAPTLNSPSLGQQFASGSYIKLQRLGVLMPFAITCAALRFASGRSRQQRSRMARQATSYKAYDDPWLGSADLGFDPLNFATGKVFDKGSKVAPETTYYNYRESEVKHGRFAMVAFLAIFFEEADRGAVLKQLKIEGAEDNLDGTLGLDEVQAPVLFLGLAVQAYAEYKKQSSENDGSYLSVEYERDRCPGDLGFDPLGLAKGVGSDLKGLHNNEVNTGRLAMIGVTAFLFKEFVAKDL